MPKVTSAVGSSIDDGHGGADGRAKGLGRLDHVVGGHHDHRPIGIIVGDDSGRQTHARSRVARSRLRNDVAGRQVGKLRSRGLGLIDAGDDHDPIQRHQGLDPGHRLLEHGQLASEAEQLFRSITPAPGPEPRPTAAGHDDRV